MKTTIFTSSPPNLTDPMDAGLIRVFAQALRLLDARAYSSSHLDGRPVDWPEWVLFRELAYATGFVCKFQTEPPNYQTCFNRILSNKDLVDALELGDIRLAMTYMMRADRFSDGGAETGGGVIWSFLQSGRAGDIARRLMEIIDLADMESVHVEPTCRPAIDQAAFSDMNAEASFDLQIRSELGHYVYALLDTTRNREVFYVGVGGGTSANGNDRVLQHFREARESLVGKRPSTEKTKRIIDIWTKGHEVEWVILRRKLPSEQEALRLEAILIDVLRNIGIGQLMNVQGGTHSKEEGFLTRDELHCLAAPPFLPERLTSAVKNRPIMLVNISKTHKLGTDAFLATSKAWKIGKRWSAREDMVVVGLVEQVAVSAYAAAKWRPCAPGRFEFERGVLEDQDRAPVLWTSFRKVLEPVFKHWGYGGIVVIQVDDFGTVRYLQGLRQKSDM